MQHKLRSARIMSHKVARHEDGDSCRPDARQEVLSCIDSLSLIFAQLLDVRMLLTATQVSKLWCQVGKRTKGWRTLKHVATHQPSCMREMHPIPPFTGGPSFVIPLPPQTNSAAVFLPVEVPNLHGGMSGGLRISVFSLKDGRVTSSLVFRDVHYYSRWDPLDVFCDTTSGPDAFTLFILTRRHLHIFRLHMDVADGTLSSIASDDPALISSDEIVPVATPEQNYCHYMCVSTNFVFLSDSYHVRALNRHNPAMFEGVPTWRPHAAPRTDEPEWLGDLCGMSCDDEVVVIADEKRHCLCMLEIQGTKGELTLKDEYTGSGHLFAPFAVALSSRYLYVLDTAEAADRVVVLDRASGATLQVMRYGPCGSSNLRCIMSCGPLVLIGDAHLKSCIMLREAHETRGVSADDAITRRQPCPFEVRGHGHGVLAFLESALAHDVPGTSFDEWDSHSAPPDGTAPPPELPVPEEISLALTDRDLHISSFRDRLWFNLAKFLGEHPHMRTWLVLPDRISDEWHSYERFNLLPYGRGPMDRPRMLQTTLDGWVGATGGTAIATHPTSIIAQVDALRACFICSEGATIHEVARTAAIILEMLERVQMLLSSRRLADAIRACYREAFIDLPARLGVRTWWNADTRCVEQRVVASRDASSVWDAATAEHKELVVRGLRVGYGRHREAGEDGTRTSVLVRVPVGLVP